MKTLFILIVVVLCTTVSAGRKSFKQRYIRRLIDRKIARALDRGLNELLDAQMEDFISDIEEIIETKINETLITNGPGKLLSLLIILATSLFMIYFLQFSIPLQSIMQEAISIFFQLINRLR